MYGNKRAFIFLYLSKIRIFSLLDTLVRCKVSCLRRVSSVVVFVFGSERACHVWNPGAFPLGSRIWFCGCEPTASVFAWLCSTAHSKLSSAA